VYERFTYRNSSEYPAETGTTSEDTRVYYAPGRFENLDRVRESSPGAEAYGLDLLLYTRKLRSMRLFTYYRTRLWGEAWKTSYAPVKSHRTAGHYN